MGILDGKSVLVTGGTGSFGQAFVQVAGDEQQPRRLIVFSRDELKQAVMKTRYPDRGDSPIRYFIGDVRDADRLRRALRGVDYVIHAAALKQVDTVEYNVIEAVKTNIMGAVNVIDAALDTGVERVLALSTDKATSPVNAYGATKLTAEKLFVQSNSYRGRSGTRFSCLRYGNVIRSRGSVIPLWEQQRESGRITITDRNMSRFLITLPQAVRCVLSSLELMQGGEVFIPKLPSVAILDLAAVVAPGCEVDYTGIRPGEKLAEMMVSGDESHTTVDLGDRYAILPAHPWWPQAAHANARPVERGWSYASHTNDWWLAGDELAKLINEEATR